jgi:hypothetical protein
MPPMPNAAARDVAYYVAGLECTLAAAHRELTA